MYYTGIDIHCKHCYVTVLDEKGKIFMSKEFDTSAEKLIEILKGIPAPNTVTFEETNLADWVYRTIKPHVKDIIVCDPRRNALIAKSKKKNDKVDSLILADLLRGGYIRGIHHSCDIQKIYLKQTVRHYELQVNRLVRIKNMLKSKFRQQGIFPRGTAVYNEEKRMDYLKQVKNKPVIFMQFKQVYEEMDLLEKAKEETRKCLYGATKVYPYIKNFMKIPGVGLITAVTFAATIDTPERFADKKKLWTYCGLGLVNRESDSKKEPVRLNHCCNHSLKSVLKKAALENVKCRGGKYHDQYIALVTKGISSSHARLTVARSISATMFSMWKSGKEYQPSYKNNVLNTNI